MKALLHQYTAVARVSEVDEDGEHPLIPKGQDRGQSRNLRTVRGSSESGVDRDTSRRKDGITERFDGVFQRLDNDRLPELKDEFFAKGNALHCDDFVAAVFPHLGYVEGGDDHADLAELHAGLVSNQEEGATVEGVTVGAVGETAFMTEASAEEGVNSFVTWGMFADLLLQSGYVSEVLKNFDAMKVLSLIELDKASLQYSQYLGPLHNEFFRRGNDISAEQFIVMMKQQFRHIFDIVSLFELHDEERKLYGQLLNLFDMIDINGRRALTWEDFTTFLVDQGMLENVDKTNRLISFTSSSVRDDMIHQAHVEKAFYFKHYDKVAFVEAGARSLKICTSDLVMYRELKDFAQAPLCAEYVDKYMYLVVSCSDLSITFYDVDNNLKPMLRIDTRTAQLVMCWSEVGQVLFSADHEGRILAWDLQLVRLSAGRVMEPGQNSQDKWKDYLKKVIQQQDPLMRHKQDHPEKEEDGRRGDGGNSQLTAPGRSKGAISLGGHESSGKCIVMMLLELPVLAQMASCGVDGNIMIWDVYTGALRRTLKKGHTMGVRCMAFAPSTKVLVSGGYDYKIFLWNPYVGKSIHTITGHAAPIVGIEVLGSGSNQVISADADGLLKVHDLGTYQCLQSFVADDILTLRAFVSIPSHKRVWACDRKFLAFDYDNTGVADQTHETPLLKVIYVPRMRIFVTGCSLHIRIWYATTGAIKCVIEHPASEITDFCLDDRFRKVFIADHAGDIVVHNLSTGVFIKKLTRHAKEVSGLVYCDGDQNVISVSWDRSVVVHDESERITKLPWRTATNVHHGDVTSVAFSRHLGLIATGSTDCVISIREYERLRTVTSLVGHKKDITALAFIEPFAMLASADVGGFVAIWAVPAPLEHQTHRHKDCVLTRFINMQSLGSSPAVTCFDPVYEGPGEGRGGDRGPDSGPRLLLYAGDEEGDAHAWDLTALLSLAEVEPCSAKAQWDPHKKISVDCSASTATLAARARSPEVPELAVMVDKQVMRRILSWRAHSDAVRSIKVHTEPSCIITSGYDHMVKIFHTSGELMTVLRAYGVSAWNFPAPSDADRVDEDILEDVIGRVRMIEVEEKVHVGFRGALPV